MNFFHQETSESSPKVTLLGNFKLKMEDDSDSISVGSIFAKRKEKTPMTLTGELWIICFMFRSGKYTFLHVSILEKYIVQYNLAILDDPTH